MHKKKSKTYRGRKPGRAIGNLAIGKAHFKNRLNFITLSWAKRGGRFIWSANSRAFSDVVAKPLSYLNRKMLKGIDLVICAGRAVTIPIRFQTSEDAKSALKCTQGASIIFEVSGIGEEPSWGALWKDSKKIHFNLIRSHQIIAESGQTHKKDAGFKKALSSLKHVLDKNEGLLHFKNQEYRLQLFICGENNFIKKRAGRSKESLFVFDLNKIGSPMRIPKFCADKKWVLINPSHRPYTPVISGGGANYNTVGGIRPTVARMLKDTEYKDGTHPPSVIIHVNNYSGEWSEKQATRVFTREGGLRCRKFVDEFRKMNEEDRPVFISRKFQIKLPILA
jgi:hypothetical protein